MTLECIPLLRNVGQFDSVNSGAQLIMSRFCLVYAENGRGKTTLATILSSLSSGNAALIENRQRLGSANSPHIVLTINGSSVVYQNGAWESQLPDVAVFDDAFVAANVCSGIEVESSHRQNLHELILGAQGVTLNTALQGHIAEIERCNRELRTQENQIPVSQYSGLSVDDFVSLPHEEGIDENIQTAERNLSAARSSDAIRQRDAFLTFALPTFDITAIEHVLSQTLPSLQAQTMQEVRKHLNNIGAGAESWVSDGMNRIHSGDIQSADSDECPFCAQDLNNSPILQHYEAYFSDAYSALKAAINEMGIGVKNAHAGDILAAFERAIRVAVECANFWRSFMDIPEVAVDTALIIRDWTTARDKILSTLRTKASAPLDPITLSDDTIAAIDAYNVHVSELERNFAELSACNAQIQIIKEQAADANLAVLQSDLVRLQATNARHSEPLNTVCNDYLILKERKRQAELARDQARAALDQYRQTIFPTYEEAINRYLGRFNAGFRIGSFRSANSRAGSSANYNVVINNIPVSLTANAGPSFRSTLSAGDRNTLALAFFFASLEQDQNIGQKIVVIDDPMTSLDEHRSLTTVEEVRALLNRVRQVIVLSHSKSFLCALWEGTNIALRSSLRINRDGAGSTLAAWDVNQDCITEHDRRYGLVNGYLDAANPAIEREVAQALRPILEQYLRVSFPHLFLPGSLIGRFLNDVCRPRLGQPNEVLLSQNVIELQELLNYANRFHHDTNSAWQTAAINDQELIGFVQRVIRFVSRA